MIQDLLNRLTTVEGLEGKRQTTTNNGTGIDTQGYEGDLLAILQFGAGGGTTPTLDVKLQDSADNSVWADVSPAQAFAQVTDAAKSLQEMRIDNRHVRRYIRFVATLTGTTPTFDGGVTVSGFKKSN